MQLTQYAIKLNLELMRKMENVGKDYRKVLRSKDY